jgi:hypothetical protein
MQPGRQIEQAGMGEKSECGYRGVHVQTGREADRHDQACEVGASDPEPPNFMPASISALGLLANSPQNKKGPPAATL